MLDGDIANSVCPDEGGVLDCPVVLTVCLIPVNANDIASVRRVKKKNESVMIIDACRQEERCASTKISISVDGKGNVCGVHKYGSSSVLGNSLGNIKFEMLPQIQNVAISCSQSVFAMLKKSHDDNGAGKGLGNAEDVYSNFFRSQFELQ
jgi:exosome complex RNA-binding protein Rrp42 (RNase PH superfamily)